MSSHNQFRMTHQRQIILQELRKTKTHPSADEIYIMVRRVITHISIGTVYRNLELLSKMGFIKKIKFDENQMRFDGNPEKHYHVSCIVCHRIDDIPTNVVKKLEYSTEGIEGYNILDHTLHFIGVCKHCSSKVKSKGDILKNVGYIFK